MKRKPELNAAQILRREMLLELRRRGIIIQHSNDLTFEELADIFWLLRSSDEADKKLPNDAREQQN